MVLVELGVVEQRLQAVLEVINDGATVVDVARRHGVSRQTVHVWLRRYASDGLPGLVDGSAKPLSCPHQMPPEVEARIVELRREQPGWGPRSIGHQLDRDGVVPLPGRSSIYRCLVRHGLISHRHRPPTQHRQPDRCASSTTMQPEFRVVLVVGHRVRRRRQNNLRASRSTFGGTERHRLLHLHPGDLPEPFLTGHLWLRNQPRAAPGQHPRTSTRPSPARAASWTHHRSR